MIHRPADNLQIEAAGFRNHPRGDEIAADSDLASADFEGAFEGALDLAVEEKAGHQSGLGLAQSGEDGRIKRDDDGAGDFAGFAKSADEGVLAAPGARRLQFEIKDDVVLFCEFEDFFKGGNAFAGEFAAKPGAGVEAAELGEGEIVNGALAAGGAV